MATTLAPPAPAAAVGYNNLTFGPSMTLDGNWLPVTGSDASSGVKQNADGSITIRGGDANHYNDQINTGGTQFGGGAYIQATLSFQNAPGGWYQGADGWPAFWGTSTSSGPHVETDFFEFMTSGVSNKFDFGFQDWQSSTSVTWAGDGGYGLPTAAWLPANFDPSQLHAYGFLWVPATSSMQGYAEMFVDGQQVGPTYHWNDVGGPYSSIDDNRLQIILGTGSANPMTVYGVQVWQGAGADDIGNINTNNTPSDPVQIPVTEDPQPVVTGSGPDSLVLKICADAFANHDGTSDAAGDAQFTVSVDGKQLGGTFTALASHSAGAEQSFTFNGYFGTGPHNVAVTFLNDAYNWGAPDANGATDRNLYVDGVTYRGSNTNQSAILWDKGSQNFTLSGGTAQPASPIPSPNGTMVTSPSAAAIIDASGNSWRLVQSSDPTKGLQIAVNGTVDAVTSNVVLLEYLNGAMVQQSSYGWYSETQPNDSWVQITNPNPTQPPVGANITTGSGSDTLVLSISEDAYANGDNKSDAAGDARFMVSVDGKQLAGTFTAQASHAAGADQTFTFKGNWAPGSHTVAVNFLNDAWAGTASTDRNLYLDKVTYDGANLNKSVALKASGPQNVAVTDNTALPPPVTGSGSDMLVLKVSEDYYLANAQFTVAVDGKQLGGTFTATTAHSSGSSQAFAFAGDFGAGQHSVSVKFLNDAWAGTPATDRNLYVNDIVYNGTDTKASAALLSTNPHAFTVSGGTTPSVTETSDHGSLQKNLSQTGTYTVGGDSFVLSSGNAASVTLGPGTSQLAFIGSSALRLTSGAGSATVTADAGANTFTAGAGSLDVTGGGGKDTYVFHANSGLLTIEDFSAAKGDKLVIDNAMKGSMVQASDYQGGTLITFGSGASHAIDVHGLAAVPASSISWA